VARLAEGSLGGYGSRVFVRGLILFLVTLAVCLPQWSFPEWHGSEGQRVAIGAGMALSGEWLVPAYGGEPVWTKPPLHYWLLGALAEVAGTGRWSMRLPAVLLLWAAAVVAMQLLRRHFSPAAGWVGALGVSCSPIVVFEFPSAEIDPVFASLTAMSLWTLATGIGRDRRGLVWISGCLGGAAVLAKGPPFLLFAAGAYLVWWRRRGVRHAAAHFLPLLALPATYYLVLWATKVAPAETLAVAREETLARLLSGVAKWEGVVALPEFLLRAVAVQLPMILWCFWEWRGARDARMDAGDVTLRICSGAAVLAVVLLCSVEGRPTRYLLPNVLLFTFAVAPAVAHFAAQQRRLGAFSSRFLRGMGAVGAVGLVVLPFVPLPTLGSFVLAGTMAVGPWLVTTPRRLVAAMLVLPVVAAWTVGLDRIRAWPGATQSIAAPSLVLRRELERHGIERFATRGFVDEELLLTTGVDFEADVAAVRVPGRDWLLQSAQLVVPDSYALRSRFAFRAPLVLAQRREAGR
jgi:4-amino-4-deoxy-L-arabinose transferase-like glycosyltransferase